MDDDARRPGLERLATGIRDAGAGSAVQLHHGGKRADAAVSGQPLSELFTEEMLRGGYRKKYLRAVSRLVALSR